LGSPLSGRGKSYETNGVVSPIAVICNSGLGGGATVWRGTGYTEDHSFTWEARIPGAVAGHVVEPDDEGSKVALTASVTGGLLATLLSPLIGMISRRNVGLEVEGLRRHCEGFVDS